MRRLLLTAAGAVALLVLVPATTSFAAPNHNQATGTGTLGQFGNPTAHVNAVQTSSHLAGSFTVTYPDGTSVSGTPTCLSVAGTTAYVIGRIAESAGPLVNGNNWQPGRFVVIGVQDNGEPGTVGPDKLNFSPGFATEPSCGPNGAATPIYTIVDGDFHVVGS